MLKSLLTTSDDPLPFIARVTVGCVIFAHGAQKLFGWFGGGGWSGTMKFFTDWGFPAALVAALIVAESIGMLSLIAGFMSRFWAAVLGVVMIVAVVKANHFRHFFMNWYAEPRGEGFEYHVLVLGFVAMILVAGGGRWSVDRMLTKGSH